jgi:hypothetical protein
MATMLLPQPATEEVHPANEEDRAVARLRDALECWWQAEDSYERAIGTTTELAAWARLRAARDEVGARERWLRWAEQDEDLLVIPPAQALSAL